MASNQQPQPQPQQPKHQHQQQNLQQQQQQQFANSNLPASSYLNPQDRVPAQRRRKSTLAGNGFFIDYSCTRRRSSAAAWQARQAQAEQQYGQQFLRTYVSPVRYPQRTTAPTSASSQVPVINQRGESFCAGSPGANNGNSPISSPSRHLSFSTQPNQQQYLATNRLSRASYCPPPNSSKLKHHSLRLHSVASPASTSIVLDGSRKTSIFDPAGHSLIAPTLMAQRRRSTMITGGANTLSPSAAAVLAEQKSQSSAAMLSVAAKSAATGSKSANKFRGELAQHVPVIGCSPTSIKASLAALDETKKYEKLLRKIKRHQKQKEKLKRKEREKRRKLKAKQMKFRAIHNEYNQNYSGNSEEDAEEELEEGEDVEIDENGDILARSSSSSTRVNQRKPSVAINQLRRKSIRAIKDAAQLIKHPQRSYKKRASHTEGLSISSISIADFDHSSLSSSSSSSTPESASLSQSASKSSHYSNSSQVEPSVEADSSNSDEDDSSKNISSGDEYRYELNNDELFEDENTMVNLSRVARSASLAASNKGDATTNKQQQQRASSYNSSKKSIVSKAMKKLAKTISNNSSDRLKAGAGSVGVDSTTFSGNEQTTTTFEQVHNETTSRGESQQQQQQQESPTTNFSNHSNNNINQSNNNNISSKNAFNQRRNSQAVTNGLNYWYYYYYLRENSADHAIDDLPISACTGLLSDSERKTRLHINYSLARIRILNSSKNSSSSKALYEKERKRRLSMRYGANVSEKLMEGVGGGESMECSLFDQHQNQESGENLRPSLDSKLPFDFSQSTDISLALSSTTISSSSSSNSNSFSIEGGGGRNSAGSVHDKDFRQHQQQQHQIPLTSSTSSSRSNNLNSNSNPNLNVNVNANINATRDSTQDSSSSSHDRSRTRSSYNSTPLSSPKRRRHRKGQVARDLQRRLSQRDVSRSRIGGGSSTLQVTRQTGQSASAYSMNQAASCWNSRNSTTLTNLQHHTTNQQEVVVENNQVVEKRFSPTTATINCQVSRGCSGDDEETSVDVDLDLNRLVATFGASTSLSSAGSREFAMAAIANSENKRKQSSGQQQQHQQQTWLLKKPTNTVIQSAANNNYCESRDSIRHQQQHQFDSGSGRMITGTAYSAAGTTSGSASSLSAHFEVAQTSATASMTANNKNLASQQTLNQLSHPTSSIGLLNLPEATLQQATMVGSNMSQPQPQQQPNTGAGGSDCLSNIGSKRSASFASSVLDNEKDELDDFERFKGSYRGFKGNLAAAMNPTPPMTTKTTSTTTASGGSNKSPSSQKSSQKNDDFSEIRRRISKYSKFRFSLKSNRNSGSSKLQTGKSEKPSDSPSNTSVTAATTTTNKMLDQSKKASKAAKMRQSSMSWDTLAGSGVIESFPIYFKQQHNEMEKQQKKQQQQQQDQQHKMQLEQEKKHLDCEMIQHGRVNRTGTVNYTPDRMKTTATTMATTSQHLDHVNSSNRLLEATSSGQIRPLRQVEKLDQEEKEYRRESSGNSNICEQQQQQQHRLSASSYQQQQYQQRGPIRAGSDKYLNATTSHKYCNEEQRQLQQPDWKSDKCQQKQKQHQQQHINHRETRETDRWFVCNAGCPVSETSEYFVGQPNQQAKEEQKINVDHYCDNNNNYHQQHLKRELEIHQQQSLHRSQRASLSCCSSEETSESTKNEQQQQQQESRQVWQQQHKQKQQQQQLGEQFSEQNLQREQTLNWDRCRARSHMSIVNLGICRAPETKSDCPELPASARIGAPFGGSSLGLQVGSQMVSVSSNRSQQDWNEREMSLEVPSQQKQQQQQQQHQLNEEITGECPICAHLEGDGANNNNNHNHRQQIDSESFAMKTMLNEAGNFSGGDTQLAEAAAAAAAAATTTTTNFQSSLQSSSKATTHILPDTKPGGGELCAVRPHSTGSGSETKPVQLVDVSSIHSNSVTLLPSHSPQPLDNNNNQQQQQQRLMLDGCQLSEESSQRCLQSVQCSLQQSQRQVEGGGRYSWDDKIIVPSTSGQLHAPAISASSSMVIYAGQTNNNSKNNKQAGSNFGPFSATTCQQKQHQQQQQQQQQQHTDGGRLNNNSNQLATNKQHHEQRVSIVPQQQQRHRLEQQCIMKMLKKNSFTCMLVGSRQSGKRSIVKCFVKLLNEFRLAVKEYRREKMLTRLMDCSERLQELQEQQEEQQQQQQQQLDRRTSTGSQMFTRSRINSWLAGSSTATSGATKILNFPYKQRLNSVATPSMHHHQQHQQHQQQQQQQHFNQQQNRRQTKQHYSGKQMELYNLPNQYHDKQQRRRHTAIEQITTSYINNSNLVVSEPQSTLAVNSTPNTGNEPSSTSTTGEVFRQQIIDKTKGRKSTSTSTTNRNFLEVESTTTTTTTTTTNRFNTLNKSDFDISYNSNQDKINTNNNNNNSNSCSTQQLQVPKLALNTTRQSISFLVKDKSDLNASSSSLGRSTQLLSPTSISAVDLNTTTNFSTNVIRSNRNNMRHTRSRNHSVQIGNNNRRRPMLSLKELNKRRIRIRFRTRRQLNVKYLNDSRVCEDNNDKEQLIEDNNNNNNTNRTTSAKYSAELPDSFMVVYSINDRKSFEYAKTLIDKIRSIKHDQLPLPVILVANKIDLERAKVVKSEEGKSLARKYSCKYMEISCTIGFNLDNLLVGIRTQLILKHHTTLNSILKHGAKALRAHESDSDGLNNITSTIKTTTMTTTTTTKKGQTSNNKLPAISKVKEPDNILVRFYKRYMTDNYEQDYDCDNFSKL